MPGDPISFIPGKKYYIKYKTPMQRIPRHCVMVCLDNGLTPNFSARPVAGTQPMPRTWILEYEEVADDAEVYLNWLSRK